MQCVGRRCVHVEVEGCLENYINQGRLLKTTTRRPIALGSSLVPNCPGLRGREKPEMYKTYESRET